MEDHRALLRESNKLKLLHLFIQMLYENLSLYFFCNRAIGSLSVYNAIYISIYSSIYNALSDTDPNRDEMVVPKLYVFEIRNVRK